MAGLLFRGVTPEITTGTSLITVWKLTAPSNHRVYVRKIDVSFKGIVVTDAPILVQLYQLTSAGTFTSLSPVKELASDPETIQTTMGHTATSTEPTKGNLLDGGEVHPQTGRRFGPLWVQGGDRIGVVITAGASTSVVVAVTGEE